MGQAQSAGAAAAQTSWSAHDSSLRQDVELAAKSHDCAAKMAPHCSAERAKAEGGGGIGGGEKGEEILGAWRRRTGTKSGGPVSKGGQMDRVEEESHCERLLRKLSNRDSASRNVQLLALRGSARGAHAEPAELAEPEAGSATRAEAERAHCSLRRQSSLIKMILGAPRAGPRFSADLCSLDSHLSGFNIEAWPAEPADLEQGPRASINRPSASRPAGGEQSGGGRGSNNNNNNINWKSKSRQPLARHANQRKAKRAQRGADEPTSGPEAGAPPTRTPVSAPTSRQPPATGSPSAGGKTATAASAAAGGRSATTKLGRLLRSTLEFDSIDLGHEPEEAQEEANSAAARSLGRPPAFRRSGSELSLYSCFECAGSGASCLPTSRLTSAGGACRRTAAVSLALTSANSASSSSACDAVCGAPTDAPFADSNGTAAAAATCGDHRQQTEAPPPLPSSSSSPSLSRLPMRGGGGGGDSSLPSVRRPRPGPLTPSGSGDRARPHASKTPTTTTTMHRRAKSNELAGAPPEARASKPGQQRASGAELAELKRQTKLIILLQVCLPFLLAGFGNMAAGLALSQMAAWQAFRNVPALLVLLPSFVGLKGNIEMTLASRLSTLSNLNLLQSAQQRRQAFMSNLALMLCHAIGLSAFATFASVACHALIGAGGEQAVQGALANGTHTGPSAHQANRPHTHASEGALGHSHHNNYSTTNHLALQYPSLAAAAAPNDGLAGSSGSALLANRFLLQHALLVVLPCALGTSILLVLVSSLIIWSTIKLANRIQVNPDNLSTLVAALYGDVTCVLMYGLMANWMYCLHTNNPQNTLLWQPLLIISISALILVLATLASLEFKETQTLVCASIVPTLTSILVSLGSGAILATVIERFQRMALYQPVVNGFGANLIAAQASRISTWLWCKTIKRASTVKRNKTTSCCLAREEPNKLAATKTSCFQFEPSSTGALKELQAMGAATPNYSGQSQKFKLKQMFATLNQCLASAGNSSKKFVQILLWSFCNKTPNSTAAVLLLLIIVPAHTLYFLVIWLLSPTNHIILTWPFYLVYIGLCLVQVFLLLLICEPLMRFLMKNHMDPDVFGISLLMSLADLIGTLCLTGGFEILARLGDLNAIGTIR